MTCREGFGLLTFSNFIGTSYSVVCCPHYDRFPVSFMFHHSQVRQTGKERDVPALTTYKTVRSAGMLDVTNRNCGPWLQRQLKDLVQKYQFDAFYLDMGTVAVKTGMREFFCYFSEQHLVKQM